MNILAFATLMAMSEQEQTLTWKLVSLMGAGQRRCRRGVKALQWHRVEAIWDGFNCGLSAKCRMTVVAAK